MSDRSHSLGLVAGLAANLLIIGLLAYAWGLHTYDPDFYYQSAQEDEYIEWGTFWAFMAAAGVSVAGALWQRRATRQIPWFLAGVGLFCFVVAMEEISWGQRVFGYLPPDYFLEKNFQQELNVHNVFSTKLRKLTLKLIIGGYGVLLPLLARVPSLGRLLDRAAIVPPPVALVPAFLAAYLTYEIYPWKFSGEWVELMLGLGFLFAALVRAREFRADAAGTAGRLRHLGPLALAWTIVMAVGGAQALLTRVTRADQPEYVESAKGELEALKHDLQSATLPRSCGMHKRLYTYVERYRMRDLYRGEFSALTAQGLPRERAEFFLDPWNSPYWIRHFCPRGSRRLRIFIYSFGPNRKRDSTFVELGGDDVGLIISRKLRTRAR